MSILGSLLSDLRSRSNKRESPPEGSSASMEALQQNGGLIIGFSGSSTGDALLKLTAQVLDPLVDLSAGIHIINVNAGGWQKELEGLLRYPIWFAMSFFGVGEEILVTRNGQSRNFWEFFSIPFLRFFGDTPAYVPVRHVVKFKSSANVYFDREHADFYRKWFSSAGLSICLPPLVCAARPLEDLDFKKKINGKIIFPKNGNSPEALIGYWRSSLPKTMACALERIAEIATARDNINEIPHLDSKILKYFEEQNLDLVNEPAVVCFLVAQLDDYVRRVKSTKIAEALLDFPVVISGKFWNHVDFQGRRAICDEECDYSKTEALMDEMLALVDMSPNTHYLVHDRISRAVGRGTTFLTNRHELLETALSSVDYMFEFEEDSIKSVVDKCLANPRETVELGIAQSEEFRAAFRPEVYAERLTGLVDAVKLRCAARPIGTQDFVSHPSLSPR
jgi:hypothetical protein